MKKLLLNILAATAVLSLVSGSVVAEGAASINIPIDTIVRGDPGSQHLLATEPIAEEFQGRSCKLTATSQNQGSVHPDNDLIVASDGNQVVLENVERTPGATTVADGNLTLGPNVTVTLELGPDGVFSAGINVNLDCQPEVEPPEFTAHVSCNVVDNKAVYTLVINQSNSTPATYNPADGTVLPNGDAIEVTATYLDANQQTQTVTATATASDNCTPHVVPPEFTAHITCTVVDNKAVYKLVVKQTSGALATFSPANGTLLDSGDAIKVTATYLDRNDQEQTVAVTADPVADCTPKITPPHVLPSTGPEALIIGTLASSGLGLGIRSWFKSRKDLRKASLKSK